MDGQTDHQRKSGGIGLVNVRRRLNLLYPNQYELKIGDNPKTYAVNLQIELDNYRKLQKEEAHYSASEAEKREQGRAFGKMYKQIMSNKKRTKY